MEILLFIICVIGAVWVLKWSSVMCLPTLPEYLAAHRDTVPPGTGVRCCHCLSRQISVWWLFNPRNGFGPKRHYCRACGKNLYRS